MQHLRLILSIIFAVGIGLLVGCKEASGPAAGADLDLATPESAVAAYIKGVKQQDFDTLIASTAAENMGKVNSPEFGRHPSG